LHPHSSKGLAGMNLTLALPPELVEAIADRTAELVLERLPAAEALEPWRLVDVEEAARRLGRSTRWVRGRKDDIGWIRLDGGALAFDLDDLRRFAHERRIACTPLANVPRSRDV
jgi:hypothetical protein